MADAEPKGKPMRFVGVPNSPLSPVGIQVRSGYIPLGEVGVVSDDEVARLAGIAQFEKATVKDLKASAENQVLPGSTVSYFPAAIENDTPDEGDKEGGAK